VLAEQAGSLRGSLETHKSAAKELAHMLDAYEALEACAEIVVRRCYFHNTSDPERSDDGYSLTLFLIGYGATPAAAAECWASTMNIASECLLKVQPHEDQAQGSELG